MKPQTYALLENYMLSCMEDSAHDKEHVYRVLYNALCIAREEAEVDMDVLIAACLLHDIGRRDQFADPTLCHAEVGSEKACTFLLEHGFSAPFAEHVRHCILTHRFRKNRQPQTLEAKILFDADKLDVTGAMGVARTLMYKGNGAEPIYTRLPDGRICDGTQNEESSFFREYKIKLEKLYDRFYTQAGSQMAKSRQAIAVSFYEQLYREASEAEETGSALLGRFVK
jgi:uncharacterized protein